MAHIFTSVGITDPCLEHLAATPRIILGQPTTHLHPPHTNHAPPRVPPLSPQQQRPPLRYHRSPLHCIFILLPPWGLLTGGATLACPPYGFATLNFPLAHKTYAPLAHHFPTSGGKNSPPSNAMVRKTPSEENPTGMDGLPMPMTATS